MKKLTVFIVFTVMTLSLVLSAIPVYAIPALPHAFYGGVTINGSPAPVGTSVEARGTGVVTGLEDNPTTTTVSGIYGTSNPFQSRLIIQGDIGEGATITFYVNGVSTGQTAVWNSGQTTELDLFVTIVTPPAPTPPAPPAPPGGEPPEDPVIVDTTLFGESVSFTISPSGEILEIIEVTTADGTLTITIPAGTIALDKNKHPLTTLTMDIDLVPPAPPEGASIIGITYDFGPEGASFDPPLTFTWEYDPNALPEGVAEEDLVVAYHDETTGEWVEMPSTVDPITNTITVSVSHFTCFAIIAAPPPPPPPPAPAPIPVPTPAPVIIVAPPPVGALPPSPTPAVAPVPVVPPTPPAAPVSPPTNWPLLGGIMAAVAVVGLIVYLLVIRPRTR